MATAKERQAAFRARLAAEGKRPVNGIVHEHQMADVLLLMQMLRDNPDLEVGLVRNTRTGRYQKL